jgi:UDP-N-acetylglucosamine--N-acetylmuramyl-(pentapeptide) pyrophosphoryl-undecaprenol N-acetylglucosamine transferase
MKLKKLFLIAGSTGGHALPIFDIYCELKNDYYIKIFVSGSEIEKQIFKGSRTVKIISGRLNRHSLIKKILGILLFAIGFIQVFFYLLFNRPKLIMAKGGFLAVPVLSAAKILGISYFTHESDSEMGLTNKKFGLSAKKLFVGFPSEMYEENIAKKAIYSGQIVRKEFVDAKPQKVNDKKIFITGGSQGSRNINKQIIKVLPKLLTKYDIAHQLGEKDMTLAEDAVSKLHEEQKKKYCHFGFSLDKIRDSLVNADLIIGRAGANTIGEISALSKASILIPYPYAASDHQNKNAKYLEKSGSAIVIKEDALNDKNLLDRIDYLFSDPKNLQILGNKISLAIRHDGLNTVTSEIRKFMKG